MEHLTTLDAGFLEAEDSDRHVSLAIGGLAVMEGPAPDHASLVSVLADRVSEIPRFTQVVRTHPLDLSAPEWVDDPQFDLAHHVHRIALPQPGDDAALYRVVADIMERRLELALGAPMPDYCGIDTCGVDCGSNCVGNCSELCALLCSTKCLANCTIL